MNKEYENISFFLKACNEYGIDKNDLFQVSSLYYDVIKDTAYHSICIRLLKTVI